jgi:hypothetical protein
MPTTTTGKASEFITFSRTSNATLTDSDGKIKWAPHNLLLASEQFDAASWVKDNSGATSPVVTSNYGAAPNGTQTADRVVLNKTGGTFSRVVQNATTPTVTCVWSVWMKTTSGGTSNVGLRINSDGVNCVVTAAWTLFTITSTTASTAQDAQILLFDSIPSNDETADILVWGAHLYRSDLGMKANTSAYPMYNPTTAKNLLGYSEDFSVGTWNKDMTATANAIVAPNGLMTADLLSGANNTYTTQVLSGANLATQQTFSMYLRAGTLTTARMAVYKSSGGQSGYVDFNLSAGTAGTPAGTFAPTNAAITPVGTDGWYRCSFRTAFDTGTGIGLALYNTSGAAGNFYAWGAQLSDSASLDTYVPNYGAAPTAAAYYGPRLDADPVTLAQRGLLVEEQRTNFLLYSAQFDQGDWLKLAGGTGVVPAVTADAGTAPDGTSTADRVQFNRGAGTTSADISRLFQDYTDPGSGVATNTVWLKSYDGVSSFTVMLQNGSGSSTITVTGSWQRFSVASTSTSANFQLRLQGDITPATADILVWGAQSEYGSFPTSYIPTGAATATRNADVASVSTQAFPYSSTESTLVLAFQRLLLSSISHALSLQEGNTTNTISFIANADNTLTAQVRDSVAGVTFTEPKALTGGIMKVGIAATANNANAAWDGVLGTQDATVTMPSSPATVLNIGFVNTNYGYLNGHIRQITYIPRRLTNTELQTRTS